MKELSYPPTRMSLKESTHVRILSYLRNEASIDLVIVLYSCN
jgi:hypothetical protein